jgi:hypothetical protein
VVDALIGLINDFAALQVYLFELGTQVLVFRVEERMKDVVPDRKVRPEG